MNVPNARPQLPALSYLEVKGEDGMQGVTMGSPAQSHSASTSTTSPTHQYGAAPSQRPPYTQAPTAGSVWSATQHNTHTPPESRRQSEDEMEEKKHNVRQSLPSLSELIGGNGRDSFPSIPPPTSGASFPDPRTDHHVRPMFPHNDQHKPIYSLAEETRLPPTSRPSPQTSVFKGPVEMGPPPATHHSVARPPVGYAPRPEVDMNPVLYQPSRMGPPQDSHTGWKVDALRNPNQPSRDSYKDTVKRHLDTQELEGAFAEIARGSSILSDFARRYGDQLYASQRAGLSPSKLPSIVEVDDMAIKAKVQLDQLMCIREFVVNQQVAFEHHVADQHQRSSVQDKGHSSGDLSPEDRDDKHGLHPGNKKTRVHRTAPPGRCHSCNRAETPEWRRGPDGARTLCNACGLHYAKLTRKNNNANKSAVITSSNLRPKDAI